MASAKVIKNAVELAASGQVIVNFRKNTVRVPSTTDASVSYQTTDVSCECQGFTKHGYCKHQIATKLVLRAIALAGVTRNRREIVKALGLVVTPDVEFALYQIADKAIEWKSRKLAKLQAELEQEVKAIWG